MAKFTYVCTIKDCGKSYPSPGTAVLHEKATGHMALKIVENW